MRLQLLDGPRHRGAGKPQVPCGTGEVPALHNSDEQPHGVETIHASSHAALGIAVQQFIVVVRGMLHSNRSYIH
jgi:hypothetical protein